MYDENYFVGDYHQRWQNQSDDCLLQNLQRGQKDATASKEIEAVAVSSARFNSEIVKLFPMIARGINVKN